MKKLEKNIVTYFSRLSKKNTTFSEPSSNTRKKQRKILKEGSDHRKNF